MSIPTQKILERALSARRGAQVSEEGDEDDESKTRKHISLAMRATNFLTRPYTGGYLWPFLFISLILLVILSLFIHSRDLVCVPSVSSFDLNSRLRFFGLDGLESDFGSLGVPWCKLFTSLPLYVFYVNHICPFDFFILYSFFFCRFS